MTKQYIMLMSVLLWSGCLLAISFMESWLKFRAPGVTLPVGLSIGKLVFSALNKMEWFFAAVIFVCYFFNKEHADTASIVLFGLTCLLLLMQTIWWLPALNVRADAIVAGKTLPSSSLHWYYIGAEIIKLSLLIVFGFRVFKEFAR